LPGESRKIKDEIMAVLFGMCENLSS